MTLPADADTYMLHESPLRLIQNLLSVDGDYAEAETTLKTGDVGIGSDGKVEAATLVELVAQTYAAAQGYRDKTDNRPIRPGYLVGVSGFQIESRPPAGELLLMRVKSSLSFDDFYLVEGQVLCGGSVVAGGTLKIWVQPQAQQQRQ
jgi:predicted hotdog family 3-hydroxylacyl-ACP dehydratase